MAMIPWLGPKALPVLVPALLILLIISVVIGAGLLGALAVLLAGGRFTLQLYWQQVRKFGWRFFLLCVLCLLLFIPGAFIATFIGGIAAARTLGMGALLVFPIAYLVIVLPWGAVMALPIYALFACDTGVGDALGRGFQVAFARFGSVLILLTASMASYCAIWLMVTLGGLLALSPLILGLLNVAAGCMVGALHIAACMDIVRRFFDEVGVAGPVENAEGVPLET